MRIYILLIFISLFFKIYAQADYSDKTKFGFIKPSGYRSFIYSGTFDETLLSLTIPNSGIQYPSEKELDLYYSPGHNISIELKKRDTRFNKTVEFRGNLDNLSYRLFNIYSEDEFALNRLIHHGFILKRTGLLTYGLMFIKMFSPVYISGYKLLGFNKLSLHNMTLLNLAEAKSNYISPLDVIQKDSTKIKSSIQFNFDWFEALYKNYLKLNEDYFQRENSIKITLHLPFNDIFTSYGIRDRTGREYLFDAGLKSYIWIFNNEALINVRFINYPLLKFTNTLSTKLFDIITISASFHFEYEEEYKDEFRSSIRLEKKTWRFNIKYTQPITSSDDFWSIKASISHK